MQKRFAMGILVLGLVGVLAGCGGAQSSSKGSGAAGGGAKEVVVNMKSTAFDKRKVEIKAGTTVKWVNQDQVDHSIFEGKPDSGKYLFQSKELGSGQEFSYTFDKPGTYEIFCNTASHHLIGMKMQVVVN